MNGPSVLAAGLLVVGTCVWAGRAEAQFLQAPAVPEGVTVGTILQYDDNVFRLPAGASAATPRGSVPRDDWSATAGLRYRGSIAPGQQVFRADVAGAATRFAELGFLDHTAVNGALAWDWRAGRLFNGRVAVDQRQSLSTFTDLREITRNVNRARTALANGELQVTPDWRVLAEVARTDVSNSAGSLRPIDLRENAAELGLRYLTSQSNSIRGGVRVTRGEYPRLVATGTLDDRYDQTEVYVETVQQVTDASGLRGRVGYTQRRYPSVGQRDFSGPTGRLAWTFRTTAKTGWTAGVRREIGAYTDLTANYVLTETAGVGPWWEATYKLRLDALVEFQRRSFRGSAPLDPAITFGSVDRTDRERYRTFGLRATWTPTRNWTVTTGWVHSSRDGSGQPAVAGGVASDRSYTDNRVFATADFHW